MNIIRKRAYARAALVGNPSDGYGGRTLSLVVRNFSAEVVLYEWDTVEIMLTEEDRARFRSVHDLALDVSLHGYYGGIRLIKATVKRFVDYCRTAGVTLHDQNFKVVLHIVEARRLFRIAMGVVDLHFESLVRPARGLKLGVKIHTGIRVVLRHDLDLQLEVREIVFRPVVKQMRAIAPHHDLAIHHAERAGLVAHLPIVERFAVEEGNPAVIGGERDAGKSEKCEKREAGHGRRC